jgi:hypothetical protein
MRRFVFPVLLAAALAAGSARAQDAGDAIRDVIARQMEAFKADDFVTAFTFASPGIQAMFGSPDRFGEMVQNGYPMVWRPADVRFSGIDTREGQTVQSVVVTDQSGAVHVLDYFMISEDGAWRINGVMLRRPADAGA